MYKNAFDIINFQWLMCHKTKPNETQAKGKFISNSGALGSVEYFFIAITPWSTLTWSGSTCYGHI